MPTISIVLPTYNGEKYIRESIDSILGQTLGEWELIIVDDCSTDRTLEIASEYADRDARIQVIHNEVNRKLPESLNIGFEHTKGKYLTWTSDDNMYLPEALAVMSERLERLDVPMVCADEYVIDEEGEIRTDIVRQYNDEELCLHNMVGACFLYRREVLDSVGEYDTELFGAEDYDYWLRIKQRYGKIERIKRILYKYRWHESSLSVSQSGKVLSVLVRLRRKHLNFILADLKNKKEILYSFYYKVLETYSIEEKDILEKLLLMLPELKNDRMGMKGKYIVFGAGDYGEKAFHIMKDSVCYYADNNRDKVGRYKNGKKIMSYEELISNSGQFDIMLAVRYDRIYQLVRQLSESGICQYYTLQTYMAEQGEGLLWQH